MEVAVEKSSLVQKLISSRLTPVLTLTMGKFDKGHCHVQRCGKDLPIPGAQWQTRGLIFAWFTVSGQNPHWLVGRKCTCSHQMGEECKANPCLEPSNSFQFLFFCFCCKSNSSSAYMTACSPTWKVPRNLNGSTKLSNRKVDLVEWYHSCSNAQCNVRQ